MRDTGAVHVPAGTGPSFNGPGDMYTFIVTGAQSGGTIFAVDCLLGDGGGPPPHRHLAEDELFVIQEGRISFTADGQTRLVGPGDSVFVPRGTAHAYLNDGGVTARMIAAHTPAGMEGWFREVCTPVIDPTQPPPPVTAELIERMLKAGPRHRVDHARARLRQAAAGGRTDLGQRTSSIPGHRLPA